MEISRTKLLSCKKKKIKKTENFGFIPPPPTLSLFLRETERSGGAWGEEEEK